MKSSVVGKANKAIIGRVVAGIGGLLAATLSLGISVYQAGHKEEVATVAPGTQVNAGRWNVTVTSSAVSTQSPTGYPLLGGKKALIVNLTLENLTARSSNIYAETLKIDNVADLPRPNYYLPKDRELLGYLQPAIPETVAAVWEVPADMPLPKTLDLSIVGEKFKPKDNLYAAPGWFNPQDVARVSLPVEGNAS
jgi:hypothetical protein